MNYDDKSFALLNTFMDFVKNPDKYSQMVADLKAKGDAYTAALKDLTGAQDIQKFYDTSMAAIEKAKQDLKDAQDALDAKQASVAEANSAKISSLSDREAAVTAREQSVKAGEARCVSANSTVEAKWDEVNSAIAKLNALKADITSREAALADKADKIRELVG